MGKEMGVGMSLLKSLLYGLILGVAEFLPISSQGHQVLMTFVFGEEIAAPFRNLLVHLACLAAVTVSCYPYLTRLYREQLLTQRLRRSRRKGLDRRGTYDIRLLKTAAVPLALGLLITPVIGNVDFDLLLIAGFFALNGLILILQDHMSHGNKTSRQMTGFDGVLMGISGVLSVLPGFSRVGMMLSAAIARGADRPNAVNWVFVLSVPALIALIILDIISVIAFGFGISSFTALLGCVLSAITAFAGAYGAIILMRFLTEKAGYSVFAYYSWGGAILVLILYLTV